MNTTIDTPIMVRMEATLRRFEKQMDAAYAKARQTSRGVEDRFDGMNRSVQRSSENAARGLTRFLNVSRHGRFVLQNTAAQIGDMAIQAEAGTPALRVMGQQLPQIFGGFGALGGAIGVLMPILGTLAAVGLPVIGMLTLMGNESEEAAAKLSELEALNLGQARSEVESLRGLQESYTEAVLEHGRQQSETSAQAVVDLGRELQARSALLALQRVETENKLRATRQTIAEMRQELSDILASVRQEAEASTHLAIGDPDAMRRRNEAIAQAILNALAANEELVASIRQGEAEATLMQLAVEALDGALEEARRTGADLAGIDFSGPIGDAADEAARLADNLWTAERISKRFGPQGGDGPPQGGRGGDPRDMGGSFFDWRNREGTAYLDRPPETRRRRSTGGRSRTKQPFFGATDRQIGQLRLQLTLVGKTRGEIARLTAEHGLLEEAKRRGLDLDRRNISTGETLREEIERQAETIGRLTDEQDRAAKSAQFYDQQNEALRDGFLDAIVEGENLAGVLANVAKAMARAALEAALFGTGPTSAGTGVGLLTGLFPSLAPRASGGPGRAGRAYRINENTPRSEIFVPSANGAVLTPQQAKSALRGGSAPVVFNQSINVSAGVSQTVRAEIQALRPQLRDDAMVAVRDARRRGATGL